MMPGTVVLYRKRVAFMMVSITPLEVCIINIIANNKPKYCKNVVGFTKNPMTLTLLLYLAKCCRICFFINY